MNVQPLFAANLRRWLDQRETLWVVKCLYCRPEAANTRASVFLLLPALDAKLDVRASEGGRFLMRECAFGNDPCKFRGGLDVFSVRASVGERRAHHEAGDVVAHLGRGDVLADAHDVAGPVAADDRAGVPSPRVHNCKRWYIRMEVMKVRWMQPLTLPVCRILSDRYGLHKDIVIVDLWNWVLLDGNTPFLHKWMD